jgi:hypothetical protein
MEGNRQIASLETEKARKETTLEERTPPQLKRICNVNSERTLRNQTTKDHLK